MVLFLAQYDQKKVTLTSSAKVEGDIIHNTIAIETGAHFEDQLKKQTIH